MKNIRPLLLLLAIAAIINGCKHDKGITVVPCGATVTDIDGNVYNTVKIGTQCWMKENLKTTRYSNGDTITEVEDSVTWANNLLTGSVTPEWCYNGMDTANNAIYGKLYNWLVVTDPRNVCPAGWHVPSDSEFEVLSNYFGGDSVSGVHLKAVTGWGNPPANGDNSSGFTALPGGDRRSNGLFVSPSAYADFWSSTADGSAYAWYRNLAFDTLATVRSNFSTVDGFSIRCVAN